MKRRSLIVAVVIAIAFLPVFPSDAQQTNVQILPNGAKFIGGEYVGETKEANASRIPQVREYLGLSARLTNPIVRPDNSIELDFVLHNGSNAPIRLAERQSPWGAGQWRLRVVDAEGTANELENPHGVWTKSACTTFIIAPSEDQIARCRLDMSTTSMKTSEGGTAIFAQPVFGSKAPLINRWVFPVSVTGIFSATKYTNTWLNATTTWEGGIATEPLVIAK
jgi:hypothetical protein